MYIFFYLRKHIWLAIWPLRGDEKKSYFSTRFLKSESHKNFFSAFLTDSSSFQPLVYYTFFFSSFWKGELVFHHFVFFCYKVYFVCDLIDLFSNVSIIRRLSIIDRTNWFKEQFYRRLFVICNRIFGITTLLV